MSPCKSCSNSIDAYSKYCGFCGAKIIKERLTVFGLFKNAIQNITNLDFPFLNTNKMLIAQPQEVTLGFIDGVRKKYTSPIKFALIILSIYGVFSIFVQ